MRGSKVAMFAGKVAAISLLIAAPAFGRARISGYCEQGGQVVVGPGASTSTTKVQQSYPSCTITALYTGGARGAVNTSGTTVTWLNGTRFNANSGWAGLTITINSSNYTISAVASPTSLTLTGSAGTQTGVSYSIPSSGPTQTVPAAIYSDNAGTVKANPTTASTTGYWFFYADNGTYDIRANGGGIPAPITWGAVSVVDPGTLPVELSDTSIPYVYPNLNSLCAAAATNNVPIVLNFVQPVATGFTCSAPSIVSNGGMIQPASGQTVTLTGQFNCPQEQQCIDMSAGGIVDFTTNRQIGTAHAGWWGVKADGVTDDTAFYGYIYKSLVQNQTGIALVGLKLKPGISVVQPGQVALTSTSNPANCYNTNSCYAPAFVQCESGALSLSTCTLKAIAGTPNVNNFVLDMRGMRSTAIRGITFDGNQVAGGLNVDNGLNGASPLNEMTGLYIVNYYGDTTSNSGTGAGGGLHAKNNNNSKIENNIHAGINAGYSVSLDAVGGPIYDLRMDGSTTTGTGSAYWDAQNTAIRNTYLKSGERSGVNSFGLTLIDNTQIVGDSVTHIVMNHTPINFGGGGWGATIHNSLLGPGTIFAGAWNGAFTTGTMFDTTGYSLFGSITNPSGASGTSTFFFHNSTWFNTAHSFTPFGTVYNVVCYSCYDAVTNTIFDFDGRGRVPFGGLTGFYGALHTGGGYSATNWAIGHQNFPDSYSISGDDQGFTSIKAEAGKSIGLFNGTTQIGSIVNGGVNLTPGNSYAVNGLGVADGTSAIVVGGTLTCPGGQHIASLNVSQRGVPTGTCN